MGCFGGRSKRAETKKRKIRYEGIEMGGKIHTLECTTPMPEEQELNAMFAELVVRRRALSLAESIIFVEIDHCFVTCNVCINVVHCWQQSVASFEFHMVLQIIPKIFPVIQKQGNCRSV